MILLNLNLSLGVDYDLSLNMHPPAHLTAQCCVSEDLELLAPIQTVIHKSGLRPSIRCVDVASYATLLVPPLSQHAPIWHSCAWASHTPEPIYFGADEEVCVPIHAPASVQPSIPDSPCSSSAPDTSTRLSTAQSIEEEDVRAPEAAPVSTDSRFTHDNLGDMTASAPGHPPPSPSKTLQPSGTGVASHPQQQRMSSTPLAEEQTGTAPSQQPVDAHPLQAEVHSAGAPEGLQDSHQAEAAGGAQALDQSLGAAGQWDDGGGVPGGAAFGCWASAAQHGDWGVMEWVACQALPALVAAARMVSPHPETEALR